MIVPRARLLFWTSLVVLPCAFLAGTAPDMAAPSFAMMGILLLLAMADAIAARKNIAGISVELPAVARMSKDREAILKLGIRNQKQRRRTMRIGLPWPREIESSTDVLDAQLPAQSEWSQLSWSCTPRKRGNYKFNEVYLEGESPLGLWAARKPVPVQSEIRVYPNLLNDRKNLSALFLNRGHFGLHAQRQVGKGRDFEKLRDYMPGDGYDEIHWKATARRGKPITKLFQIEKTQEVYVIVDRSRLSARTAGESIGDASALERFVTAALVLGLAAEQQGDSFGLLAFGDKVEKFVRAKNGQAHYNACRDALYTLQPEIVTPDFDELCTFIRLRLRRRALLIFLTALDDPAVAESFVRSLALIRRQHLILVNMLQPPGVKPLFSNPAVKDLDDIYKELGGHLRWQKLRELQKILGRMGVQFSLLKNERLSAELVSQYLSVKQRQLL
ncbi:MAG TPA: DUF58 domain-containing protein [Alphaproteobacteria bacterium]|nr:DUF58 domain-containing protein [Verrucomicrobiae bacterium]HUA64510.1 DUF58 domain-containing protein [Alphaproteobacteria bacterium]